jgi:glycosyltransferase involved in cell wall biosynthesis
MARVSIGLPVFNGEKYLAEAIASVLEQTYSDTELIITDNASTDGTQDICAEACRQDKRIRYFRNEKNLGAAPNYNLAWSYANGEYFKWLAHDDRIKPRFIEAAVAALDADPAAVLCNSEAEYIDGEGRHLGFYRSVLARCESGKPAEQLAAVLLNSHTCIDFFGLIRREAMVGSILHEAFSGADKAFIAQMALRGRLIQLAEALVEVREHPHRYTRTTKSARMKLNWHDTSKSNQVDFPVLTLYRTCRELVEKENLSATDRSQCRWVMRRFWFNWLNFGRLAADFLSVPFPSAVDWAFRVRYRLFGAPGNFLD